VSVWFLLLQAVVRPYRIQWVNHLQLLSGWCLVMLAILNASSSSVFVSVGVNIADTPFAGLGELADWLMFVLLWPPVTMLAVCTANEIRLGKGEGGENSAAETQGQLLSERQKHRREKDQLVQENGRLEQEKEQLLQEKAQDRREKERLVAQLAAAQQDRD
jgi:hypothetical protein